MARILFFTILAMCLVCVLQASPIPDPPTTEPDTYKQVETAVQNALAEAQKGLQAVFNDANVQKVMNELTKFRNDAAAGMQETWNKVIPNTA